MEALNTKLTMDEVTARRAEYMANKLTHQEYYQWLAESIGITLRMLPVGHTTSTDPHFNDVALQKWDSMHEWVLTNARSYFRGKFVWSLSDSVCCLKAIAQRERNKRAPGPLLSVGANGETIATILDGSEAA